MKYYKLFLWAFLSAHIITSSHASDQHPLNDYIQDMERKNLPSVLIVGCGHELQQDVLSFMYDVTDSGFHMHPNCWCIDRLEDFSGNPAAAYWLQIKADDCVDITREFPHSSYKERFDVVVLERPRKETLNTPRTLWNAVNMLKEGGELIIDHHHSYTYDSYTYDDTLYKPAFDPKNNRENRSDKLHRFGIDLENGCLIVEDRLLGMAQYLRNGSMSDIICIKNAPNIYTKMPNKNITESRKTSLLFATKTEETRNSMADWENSLISYRGSKKFPIGKSKSQEEVYKALQEKLSRLRAEREKDAIREEAYKHVPIKPYTPVTDTSAEEAIQKRHREEGEKQKELKKTSSISIAQSISQEKSGKMKAGGLGKLNEQQKRRGRF